ncbi:MAG: hypothetical protein AAB725_00010 [Patescibacteria group bacterium]
MSNKTLEKGNSISKLVLEKLSEIGSLTLDGLLPRNRVESRIWRRALGLPEGYEFSQPTFSVVLNRLKNQGLVAKTGGRKYAIWLLTPKGKNKIDSYYIKAAKSDGVPRLVMYDVPETERKKRDLLRYELVACDYRQLQKSVWLGYAPLPEEFIQSLKDMNLKNKVQIVSIHKSGTLAEF